MQSPLLQGPSPEAPGAAAAQEHRTLFPNSDIFFSCARPILAKGTEPGRKLVAADAEQCRFEDIPCNVRDRLLHAWEARVSAGRPSLAWTIMDCSWGLFIQSGTFHCIEILVQFLSPPLIKLIVAYAAESSPPVWKGICYAVVFFSTPFLQSFFSCHFILRCRRLGMQCQGGTACLVFEKVLRLSQPALSSYGPGALVNIMQVDTFRFGFAFFFLGFLWSMPLMFICGVVFLYQQLGVAAFVCIVIMVLMYPLNNLLAKQLLTLSRSTNISRDARIKLLTEVLHAARLIKMLAWENKIGDLVGAKRNDEMSKISKFKVFDVINGLVWQGVPTILPLITFGTFVACGGTLSSGLVFSSLALIDLLRVPMNLFPQALQILVQVKVGMDRIENVLLASETKRFTAAEASMLPSNGDTGPGAYVRTFMADSTSFSASSGLPVISSRTSAPIVRFSAAAFRWSKADGGGADQGGAANQASQCCARWRHRAAQGPAAGAGEQGQSLASANTLGMVAPDLRLQALDVVRGKLVFVVGAVGAGKSTFAAALLNEVPLLHGRVEVMGPIAYCAQIPWILHGTVKDNILFGSPYEPTRFAEVITKCALEADMEELRDGPETVIGERGVNLSGGQKARLGLARAAYMHSTTNLYILDDPLSAVDMHVAKHLIDECIGSARGLLRNTTRILVTHQLQYMNAADIVIVVRGGEIVACRPPTDFTTADLQAYGIDLDGPESQEKQPTGKKEATPIELKRATSGSSAASVASSTMMMRQISGVSDTAALAGGAGVDIQVLWKEACLPTQEQGDELELGAARLHPLNRGRAAQLPPTLLRSISEHVARPAPILQRSLTLPAPDADGDLTPTRNDEDINGDAQQASGSPGAADEEEREVGALSMSVWCAYAKVMGMTTAGFLAAAYLLTQGLQLAATFWLANWSGKPNPSREETFFSLSVYAMFSLGAVGLLCFRMLIFRWTSLRVSTMLHKDALWCVLRAPMSWLDTNPSGRVINRFSQDMQRLDMELQGTISNFADTGVQLLISVVVVGSYVPLMIPIVIPLIFFYNRVQNAFRMTARELQRLSSRSKSPIFQGLDEAIVGVSTIRAYEQEAHFISRNAERIALNTQLDCNVMACNRWLTLRLRALGTIAVAIITILVVLQKHPSISWLVYVPAATVGLVLRYALQFTSTMEGLLQSLTQTELCLVALERVMGYTKLENEPALEVPSDSQQGSWPTSGEIKFEEVTMRYRSDLPTVLNGISFIIPGGTSVGVVGRTGAGKSSLLQALFRVCSLDGGVIRIDGVDTATLGLHTLRRRLAIIPQDPIGFTGSLRFNLDPFQENRDEAIWAELGKVQLREHFASKEEGLDYHLTAGGENLSVGQRQLVCAARALLRQNRILVLDEATASVDFKTDRLIQEVLRNEVTNRNLTTITIAHRINTIMGADNVLFMDKGMAAEFGPPRVLAADRKSKFHALAIAAGDH